jgi:hypothetical protein
MLPVIWGRRRISGLSPKKVVFGLFFIKESSESKKSSFFVRFKGVERIGKSSFLVLFYSKANGLLSIVAKHH